METRVPARRMELSQKVFRKDGRVEDLGMVAYWHQSATLRAIWAVERRSPASIKARLQRLRERLEHVL